MLNMQKIFLLLSGVMFINGCSGEDWFGEKKELVIDGERISILSHEQNFAKSDLSKTKVQIIKATDMNDWTQSGGTADHYVANLKFAKKPTLRWNKNIGEGSSYANRLIAEPVAFNEVVYAFDSVGKVTAYDLNTGTIKWEKDFIKASDENSVIGSGLAIGDDMLFITSGVGKVMAININDQSVVWEKSFSTAIRTAPTYADGFLYFVTADSKLFALDAKDGSEKWYYASIQQDTTILGGAAPTVVDDTVISVFPSGEIIAFNAETGTLLWGEVLTGSNRLEGLSILMDIVARPVAKDGILYVMGHSDIFMAVDIKTGKQLWQQNLGGTSNPAVVSDYIFVITNDGDLVALERKDGKIIWVRTLPKYIEETEKKGRITWQGPMMLNSRLLVVGSYGEMAFLNPVNGNLLSREKVAESIQIPPVYADENLILLNSQANLMVYK